MGASPTVDLWAGNRKINYSTLLLPMLEYESYVNFLSISPFKVQQEISFPMVKYSFAVKIYFQRVRTILAITYV